MTAEVAGAPGVMRDWKHYMLWWCIWMGLGGMLMPVYGPDAEGASFWIVKLFQFGYGVLFGVACALVFTLAQNTLNVTRKKWLSWVVAIVIWMGLKFAFAAATGQFS